MTKALLLAMSCGVILGSACATDKASGDSSLIDRRRPAPREGVIPMRHAAPAALDRVARQALEDFILDALDTRWRSAVTPFRFGVYEDDRKHLVVFVIYDYSPLDAWEGRMEEDVHSQELARIDAQIEQCEDALNTQGQTATDEEYNACITQAYPQSLRPFVSEGSGVFCTELRVARFELGLLSALNLQAPPPMREVHDVLLRSPVCEVMTVSELEHGDYDADGLVELSFTVEANMYQRAQPHDDERQAQFGFVLDASRGALQWSAVISGDPRSKVGRYRIVSPAKTSPRGLKGASEIELERFALNAKTPDDSLFCYEELFEQLKKKSAWTKRLEVPEGCTATPDKLRYYYARALDRWEPAPRASKPVAPKPSPSTP